MKRKTATLLLLLCAAWCGLRAQNNLFNKQYVAAGETSDAVAHLVTLDGGTIIASVQHPDLTTNYNIAVIKTDANGSIQWTKKIPTVRPGFRNIVQSADGTYFLCYSEFQFGHYFEAIHLDVNGNVLFDQRMNLPAGFQATWEVMSIAKPSGGYYIACSVRDTVNGMYYWNLTQLSSVGAVSWSNNYNADFFLGALIGIQLCTNGDLLLLGNQYNTASQCYDGIITRITGSGSFLWTKHYAYSGHDLCPGDAAETAGSFVISVQDYQQSAGLAAVDFLKIDGTGTLTWVMRYTSTGPNSSLLPYDLISGGGNDFTVVAERSGPQLGSVLLKVDAAGQYISSRFYPQYTITSLEQRNAWQYSLAGTRDSLNEHYVTLITTDLNGTGCTDTTAAFGLGPVTYTVTSGGATVSFPLTAIAGNLLPTTGAFTEYERCNITGTNDLQQTTEAVELFPSPAGSVVTVRCISPISQIEIMDMTGRAVKSEICNSSQIEITIADLPEGVYVARIYTESGVANHRFVVSRH